MAKSVKTGSEELGELIRGRRQHLGLRRRDLVEATGLSYPYVSQIETGYRLPSDRAVRDLAAALQVAPAELLAAMPAERQTSSTPRIYEATSGASEWFINPGFAISDPASAHAPSARGSEPAGPARVLATPTGEHMEGFVDDILRALAGLGVEDQLEALTAAQRRLVGQLVNDRHPRSQP